MPPSAYFTFCRARREEERERLQQAAGPGAKVAVTAVAQALGERWKTLSDEERAEYKRQAAAEAEAAAAAAAQAQGGCTEGGGDAGGAEQQHAPRTDAVPVSWVRKVVSSDAEVSRCSADAAQALAGAAEVFLSLLCKRASSAAQRAKRRTVKLEDLDAAARADRRLAASGMKDVCAFVAEQQQQQDQEGEEPNGEGGQEAKREHSKDKRPKLADNHRIERFFAAG